MKNHKNDICAYCGSHDDLNEDHIPPKNLFPKPRPNNLIKVQACPRCHSNQTSRDDEYFCLKILMREGVQSNPAAKIVWNKVLYSLLRNKATGFRKGAIEDFVDIELKTKSGLYVGKRYGYHVNMNRIRNVIQRIVIGLYFFESGYSLGLNNKVSVYMDDELREKPPEILQNIQKTILNPLANIKPKIIGDNVFSYRYHIIKDKPSFSVWGMLFYQHTFFLALTLPLNLNQNL